MAHQIDAGAMTTYAAHVYERTAALCFYIAFGVVRDRAIAERVTQESLVRVFRALQSRGQGAYAPMKWAATITASYFSLEEREQRTRGEKAVSALAYPGTREAPMGASHAHLALQRVSARHRIFLLLDRAAGLSRREIAQVLNLPLRKVDERMQRAYTAYSRALERTEPHGKAARDDLDQIAKEWVFQDQAAAEAMSNVEPNPFSPGFAEETLEKMVSAHRTKKKPTRSLESVGAGILLGALLLFALFYRGTHPSVSPTTEREQSSYQYADLRSEETPEEASSDRMIRMVTVPKGAYAAYADRIVFFDAREKKLYFARIGEQAQSIYDLSDLEEEHGGIEAVGEKEGVFYLAFLDGTGAKLVGDPPVPERTPYWYTEWFEGQSALSKELRQGLIIDHTQFTFSTEEAPNRD